MIQIASYVKHLSIVILAIFIGGPTAKCAVAETPAPGSESQIKHTRTLRVFGKDDRTRVLDATIPPFASMGMITAQFGRDTASQTRVGTGALISDRVVLTCAHVVYEPSLGWADYINFYPERNGQTSLAPVSAAPGLVRDSWASSRDDNNDISLILLDRAVGQDTGVMAVASKPVSFFSGPTLNLTGYASDLAWSILYTSTGPAVRVDENLVVHYIDGGPGQSGGPLWYLDEANGHNTIVGVFTGDAEVTVNGQLTDVYGIGVRVNSEICAWINDYMAANDPTATTFCDTSAGEDPVQVCGRGVGGTIPFALAALALMGKGCRRTLRRLEQPVVRTRTDA